MSIITGAQPSQPSDLSEFLYSSTSNEITQAVCLCCASVILLIRISTNDILTIHVRMVDHVSHKSCFGREYQTGVHFHYCNFVQLTQIHTTVSLPVTEEIAAFDVRFEPTRQEHLLTRRAFPRRLVPPHDLCKR